MCVLVLNNLLQEPKMNRLIYLCFHYLLTIWLWNFQNTIGVPQLKEQVLTETAMCGWWLNKSIMNLGEIRQNNISYIIYIK